MKVLKNELLNLRTFENNIVYKNSLSSKKRNFRTSELFPIFYKNFLNLFVCPRKCNFWTSELLRIIECLQKFTFSKKRNFRTSELFPVFYRNCPNLSACPRKCNFWTSELFLFSFENGKISLWLCPKKRTLELQNFWI